MKTDDLLTTPQLIAMSLVSATELSQRWLEALGPREATIRELLRNGAGIEMSLELHPEPTITMLLRDTDGSRMQLAIQPIGSHTAH